MSQDGALGGGEQLLGWGGPGAPAANKAGPCKATGAFSSVQLGFLGEKHGMDLHPYLKLYFHISLTKSKSWPWPSRVRAGTGQADWTLTPVVLENGYADSHFPRPARMVLCGKKELWPLRKEEQRPLTTQGCLNDMHPVMNFQSVIQGFPGLVLTTNIFRLTVKPRQALKGGCSSLEVGMASSSLPRAASPASGAWGLEPRLSPQ